MSIASAPIEEHNVPLNMFEICKNYAQSVMYSVPKLNHDLMSIIPQDVANTAVFVIHGAQVSRVNIAPHELCSVQSC